MHYYNSFNLQAACKITMLAQNYHRDAQVCLNKRLIMQACQAYSYVCSHLKTSAHHNGMMDEWLMRSNWEKAVKSYPENFPVICVEGVRTTPHKVSISQSKFEQTTYYIRIESVTASLAYSVRLTAKKGQTFLCQELFSTLFCVNPTASVVLWSDFLSADPEFPGSIPGVARFSV
jgi:hypothetical protein